MEWERSSSCGIRWTRSPQRTKRKSQRNAPRLESQEKSRRKSSFPLSSYLRQPVAHTPEHAPSIDFRGGEKTASLPRNSLVFCVFSVLPLTGSPLSNLYVSRDNRLALGSCWGLHHLQLTRGSASIASQYRHRLIVFLKISGISEAFAPKTLIALTSVEIEARAQPACDKMRQHATG